MALFRKFNYFIFLTVAGSVFSIVILGCSIGTKNWYTSKIAAGTGTNITVTVVKAQYGMFSGKKTSSIYNSGGEFVSDGEVKKIQLVCITGENACMYSCGVDSKTRQANLEYFLKGGEGVQDELFCTAGGIPSGIETEENIQASSKDKKVFLNFGLWLVTLIFLCGGILFSTIAGALALLNTYRAPSQPILSVFGLYIWNGLAAGCTLLVLILWGAIFGSGLKENPAVSHTISGDWVTESSSMGYSYWIIILAECLCLVNIGMLRYRTWKIHQIETKLRVVSDKATNPETLLF